MFHQEGGYPSCPPTVISIVLSSILQKIHIIHKYAWPCSSRHRAHCQGNDHQFGHICHVIRYPCTRHVQRIDVHVIRYDTVDALRKVRLSETRIARAAHKARHGEARQLLVQCIWSAIAMLEQRRIHMVPTFPCRFLVVVVCCCVLLTLCVVTCRH